MPLVRVHGTDLFYVEVGCGVPCLIMHGGLGVDHTQFREWLDPLSDTLHLVYYGHRGNGRSGRPSLDTLTFDQLVADADALGAQLGFDQIAVMGHSTRPLNTSGFLPRPHKRSACTEAFAARRW